MINQRFLLPLYKLKVGCVKHQSYVSYYGNCILARLQAWELYRYEASQVKKKKTSLAKG